MKPDSTSDYMSLIASGGATMNPKVAAGIAGLKVLGAASKERKQQEMQRKQDRMTALESYMNLAQQMGQGL